MQNKFKDTALMIGERGHILPEASAEHLIHAYEFIGKMIAHAVRLGCHGFPGLSPALQSYIVYGQGLVNLEDFRHLFPLMMWLKMICTNFDEGTMSS
jgi:hypothetical protein